MMNNTPESAIRFIDAVCRSNDQAVENGYDLFSWAPEEIAVDIADYDLDFEGADHDELIEAIREWFRRHNRVPPIADLKIMKGHDH